MARAVQQVSSAHHVCDLILLIEVVCVHHGWDGWGGKVRFLWVKTINPTAQYCRVLHRPI